LPGKQVWLNNRFLHRDLHGWPLQLDAVHPGEIVLKMKDRQNFMERVRYFHLIAHSYPVFYISLSISLPPSNSLPFHSQISSCNSTTVRPLHTSSRPSHSPSGSMYSRSLFLKVPS
jgi:hypothetical protein